MGWDWMGWAALITQRRVWTSPLKYIELQAQPIPSYPGFCHVATTLSLSFIPSHPSIAWVWMHHNSINQSTSQGHVVIKCTAGVVDMHACRQGCLGFLGFKLEMSAAITSGGPVACWDGTSEAARSEAREDCWKDGEGYGSGSGSAKDDASSKRIGDWSSTSVISLSTPLDRRRISDLRCYYAIMFCINQSISQSVNQSDCVILIPIETVIFFSNRVINAWNSLSDYIVTSPTVACFKRRIVKLKFLLGLAMINM